MSNFPWKRCVFWSEIYFNTSSVCHLILPQGKVLYFAMLTYVPLLSTEKIKNLSLTRRNETVINGIFKSHTFRKSIVSARLFLAKNTECLWRYATSPLLKRFLVIINLPAQIITTICRITLITHRRGPLAQYWPTNTISAFSNFFHSWWAVIPMILL